MFVASMTPEEKKAEALNDFRFIKTKVEMALDTVKKHIRQGIAWSLVKRVKITTKNNNTWTVAFVLATKGIWIFIYTPIRYHKRDRYIALSNIVSPNVMEYTAHFLQRYNERYLTPNNINTGQLSHLEYFMLYNNNTQFNNQKNGYMVSDHGYMEAVEPVDRMIVHLTFIGNKNLTNRKEAIYSLRQSKMDAAKELSNYRGEVTPEVIESIVRKHFDSADPELIESWKRWTS